MNFNYKKPLAYLAYSLGLISLLVLIGNINSHFIKIINETFRIYPWQIYVLLMYFPIGIYLGIPNLLKVLKKTGRWRIDYYKIVLVGLPMIYVSFYWIFPFSYPILSVLTFTKSVFSFGTLIAGYIIISSFTKE